MFTQISAKQGIKHFKYRAVASISKEYKQLHDMHKFGIVYPEDPTPKYKRDALRAITFIKDKRSGKVKGIACTDGRAQRAYITK